MIYEAVSGIPIPIVFQNRDALPKMAADPIAMITGLVGLFQSVKRLCGLVKRYREAEKDLDSLRQECQKAGCLLQSVKETVSMYGEHLKRTEIWFLFNTTVTAMEELLKELTNQLSRWDSGKKSRFGFFDKTRFIWDDAYLKETREEIRASIPYFEVIITLIGL